jgi:asparaginyl-tRNA synthetase
MVDSAKSSKEDVTVIVKIGKLYICEQQGNDKEGSGSEKMPYQSLQKAANAVKGELAQYEVLHRKVILDPYQAAAKTAVKKAIKNYQIQVKKDAKDAERAILDKQKSGEAEALEKQKLEEAKSIVLTQDKTLPAAKAIKLFSAEQNRDCRVKVSGWVHRLRVQGKDMMFIVLRDGYGYIQCVLTGKQCQTIDAITLTLESTVVVYGSIKKLPEGKSVRILLI